MGMSEERKRQRKEKKTQAILRATRSIFLAKGFMDATMLDVAEELSISRRTLYLYFKSKEDLSFAAIADAFEELRDRLQRGATMGTTGLQKLQSLTRAYKDFYKNNYETFVFTLYFDYSLNPRTSKSEGAAKVFSIIHDIEADLVKVFVEAERDGSVQLRMNPQKTAATVMTVILGYMQKVAIQQDYLLSIQPDRPTEMIENLFTLLFQAVKTPVEI